MNIKNADNFFLIEIILYNNVSCKRKIKNSCVQKVENTTN